MKRPHPTTTTIKPKVQFHITTTTKNYNHINNKKYNGHHFLLNSNTHLHSNVVIRLITFCIIIILLIHAYLFKVTLKRPSLDNNGHQQHTIPLQEKLQLNDLLNYKISAISESSIDQQYYTIRMNTWKRNEQLLLSINQHSKCEGVLQIQIVWCDSEVAPPEEVLNHPSGKVVVEYHSENSLNERFHILSQPPTIGILSLDDDLIYPCAALDSGFLKWAQNPQRMIGFDARSHVAVTTNDNDNEQKWKYAYMSTTNESNKYSLTLPRACFIHRDYFNLYIHSAPRSIVQTVQKNFNCEDIAMSFFISFMNHGEPPLLVNYWATQLRTKLYVHSKISGTSNHKSTRDSCVNDFADVLGLKSGVNRLRPATLRNSHNYGYQPEHLEHIDPPERYSHILDILRNSEKEDVVQFLRSLKDESMKEAVMHGMVEHTDEWSKRWNKS